MLVMTIMIGHGKEWWSNGKDMIFGADKYTRPKNQNKTKKKAGFLKHHLQGVKISKNLEGRQGTRSQKL